LDVVAIIGFLFSLFGLFGAILAVSISSVGTLLAPCCCGMSALLAVAGWADMPVPLLGLILGLVSRGRIRKDPMGLRGGTLAGWAIGVGTAGLLLALLAGVLPLIGLGALAAVKPPASTTTAAPAFDRGASDTAPRLGVATASPAARGAAVAPAQGATASLAPQDVDFRDARGGWGWGDRCFLHIKAGRLANARAACDRGLAEASDANVRGALLYNLGLIEERSGNPDAARARYEESLRARPGNAVVAKALAALSPPAGATGLVKLEPASVSASSAMRRPGDDHPAQHAFDGDVKTAWNESAPGPGRGEWLEARLDAPRTITRVKMSTGYASISPKFGDLFVANAHVKRLSVLVDGAVVKTIDVGADERWITIDLEATGQVVRFVADDVYAGAKWQDLCVAEVEIYGR
jgi:hypothetical protein